MDQWVTIRTLKRQNPSWGSRMLAKIVGVSRNTVKRALADEEEPRYERPVRINAALAPFQEYIHQQLIVKGLCGSRVLKEIRSKGFTGSQSAFYRYLRTLQQPVARTFHPYETAPGEQAQFDWSEYTVVLAGVLRKVYVFIFLLGYSRFRIYQASLSVTQASVFEAMENSLHALGGVPHRSQTDNAKCFVLHASREALQWNPRYVAFCGHYGMHYTRCLPQHPWSKGKVENPFDYLEDHFIAGNTFFSFEDFIERLAQFQNEVNNRVHTTTKQTPAALLQHEASALLPLPATRYVGVKEEVRKVTADCLVSFNGSRYSVPYLFALRDVWLRVSHGYTLEIYSSNNALIASHRLSPVKGKIIMNDEHYTNHRIERGNWQRLCTTFLQRFPDFQWFLDNLHAQKRINHPYHLTQVLDLAAFYDPESLILAFGACHKYNMFNVRFIKSFLENQRQLVASSPAHCSSIWQTPPITRPLSEYNAAIHITDQ